MAATSNEKRGKLHLDIKLAQVSVLSLSLSLSLSVYEKANLRCSVHFAVFQRTARKRGEVVNPAHCILEILHTRNIFQLLRSFKLAGEGERERERENRARTRTRAATHIFSASRHRAGMKKRFSRASRASCVSARRSRFPDDKSSSTESRARFLAAKSILETGWWRGPPSCRCFRSLENQIHPTSAMRGMSCCESDTNIPRACVRAQH